MALNELDALELAKVAGASIGSLLVLAYPLMRLVRMWNIDRKDSTKDASEGLLYTHLSEQVKTLSELLDKSRAETQKLATELAHMKSRLAILETYEESNKRLKEKLDLKDDEIKELTYQLTQYRKRSKLIEERLRMYETVSDFAPFQESRND